MLILGGDRGGSRESRFDPNLPPPPPPPPPPRYPSQQQQRVSFHLSEMMGSLRMGRGQQSSSQISHGSTALSASSSSDPTYQVMFQAPHTFDRSSLGSGLMHRSRSFASRPPSPSSRGSGGHYPGAWLGGRGRSYPGGSQGEGPKLSDMNDE